MVRWVLAVLMLAQLINVAQACLLEVARPAMAFAGAPCEMGDPQRTMLPNACLAQCLQADQSTTADHTALPLVPNVAALIAPEPCVSARLRGLVSSLVCHGGTGPPPSIRFCSMLL